MLWRRAAGKRRERQPGVAKVSVLFIVRAEVTEADREAFDCWYETEHLPEAMAAFKTLSARRGWSEVDDGVHIAFYEFADMDALKAVTETEILKGFIAEFDRVWGDRVKRSRDIVPVKQVLGQ